LEGREIKKKRWGGMEGGGEVWREGVRKTNDW
jgi:hypothetical protein